MNKSLKNDLLKILIFCAWVPLVLITFFATYSFNKLSNHQLLESLDSGVRSFQYTINDLKSYLEKFSENHIKTKSFSYLVETKSNNELKLKSQQLIDSSLLDAIFVSKNGNIEFSIFKDHETKLASLEVHCDSNSNDTFYPVADTNLFYGYCVPQDDGGHVILLIEIKQSLLKSLEERSNLEFSVLHKGKVVLSSLNDMVSYPSEFFNTNLEKKDSFNIEYKGQNYKFLFAPIFEKNSVYVGVGKNSQEQQEVLKNVELGLAAVSVAIILVMIPILFFLSRNIFKPIQRLNSAVNRLTEDNEQVDLSVERSDELGMLIKNFNKMGKTLKQTQAQLVQSEKMASLGQLVAGVAHEINNPLSFISANIPSLKDYSKKLLGDFSSLPEPEREYIRKDLPKLVASLEEGSQRASEIVKSLKSFSYQDKGNLTKVQINEEVKNITTLLRSEFSSMVNLKLDLQATKSIEVNRNEINQVLINLVTNAIQALEGKTGEIVVRTKDLDRGLLIEVQDSGVGISPENIQRIFEPFYTTKEVGKGTGLGLSVSHNIITKHGGKIWAEVSQPTGTVFKIELP